MLSRHPSRRDLLIAARRLALSALLAPAACQSLSRPRFRTTPFPLGVASGEPGPDGFVIWTRLADDPDDPAGLGGDSLEVAWEVAEDPRFAKTVRQGTAFATAERGHAIHVELTGLMPDRPYWYRFLAAGEASATGRAFTTPRPGAPAWHLRFAVASCQHFEQGTYVAYRHMVEDDVRLVLHLGDYIYEQSWGRQLRKIAAGEPRSLGDYRLRYAVYKSDPDLRAAHAAAPWIVTWDDHEVDNDYAADQSQDFDDPAAFLRRRAAAYRAYFEHMPLRPAAAPRGPDMRLYRHLSYGDLIGFHVLDTRQYRADQACATPEKGGGQVIEPCPEWHDPRRSHLGLQQEAWLRAGLGASSARWNVLAQQMPMTRFDRTIGPGERFWSDGWDGYAPARRRLMDWIAEARTANPVVLSGDIHSFWVNDLKRDFRDGASPTVATEFVGTSITSAGLPYDEFVAFLPENPHVKFMESRHRGYLLCEVTPRLWHSDLRIVSSIASRDAPARSLASFVVENGSPGARIDRTLTI